MNFPSQVRSRNPICRRRPGLYRHVVDGGVLREKEMDRERLLFILRRVQYVGFAIAAVALPLRLALIIAAQHGGLL